MPHGRHCLRDMKIDRIQDLNLRNRAWSEIDMGIHDIQYKITNANNIGVGGWNLEGANGSARMSQKSLMEKGYLS